jgi:hypothetical protein
MRHLTTAIIALTLWLGYSAQASAASTAKVYNSGILVLVFLGFCALVVVMQLIPAIITLVGMLRGLVKGGENAKEAKTDVDI